MGYCCHKSGVIMSTSQNGLLCPLIAKNGKSQFTVYTYILECTNNSSPYFKDHLGRCPRNMRVATKAAKLRRHSTDKHMTLDVTIKTINITV